VVVPFGAPKRETTELPTFASDSREVKSEEDNTPSAEHEYENKADKGDGLDCL
jgi:hypothetical protein